MNLNSTSNQQNSRSSSDSAELFATPKETSENSKEVAKSLKDEKTELSEDEA